MKFNVEILFILLKDYIRSNCHIRKIYGRFHFCVDITTKLTKFH